MSKTSAPQPTPITTEQYWTTKQVAERLHCSVDTVKHWLILGKLRKTKAGAKTLVTETHLQEFLRRSTEQAEKAA
jgi:excisionase family DNA binding protein